MRLWREHDTGGHFAAMEQSQLLVTDIRDFFRPLRAKTAANLIGTDTSGGTQKTPHWS
jgi:hypothetical protein